MKKIFKNSGKLIVVKYGKNYKFNTFEEAVAFMLSTRR